MYMAIPLIYSAKRIEQQFNTGEQPVLVMCSDVNTYVCKYMRSSAAAYKLVCELVGSQMAKAWQLNTPDIALVRIKSVHWEGINLSHSISSPSLGSRWLDGVIDITPSTYAKVPANAETLYQLMKIALFDFWMANEDRNANNANLMYDVVNDKFVSIDYGCVFNTATFEYSLSQLTSTDTILWSDLFAHLSQDLETPDCKHLIEQLNKEYKKSVQQCRTICSSIIEDIPEEWNVSLTIAKDKTSQLFEEKWLTEVWNNFIECFNENIDHV